MKDISTETWALDDKGNKVPGTGLVWVGPERCEEKFFLGGRCVGPKDHPGHCWCYSETGCYNHWNGVDEYDGIIPPDHKDYPNPIDMIDQTYRGLGEWEVIEEEEDYDE